MGGAVPVRKIVTALTISAFFMVWIALGWQLHHAVYGTNATALGYSGPVVEVVALHDPTHLLALQPIKTWSLFLPQEAKGFTPSMVLLPSYFSAQPHDIDFVPHMNGSSQSSRDRSRIIAKSRCQSHPNCRCLAY